MVRLEDLMNLLPLSFRKIQIIQSLPTKTAKKATIAKAVPLRRSHGKRRATEKKYRQPSTQFLHA
jgi:hypothetical protein